MWILFLSDGTADVSETLTVSTLNHYYHNDLRLCIIRMGTCHVYYLRFEGRDSNDFRNVGSKTYINIVLLVMKGSTLLLHYHKIVKFNYVFRYLRSC
jgi:hypothetical protein